MIHNLLSDIIVDFYKVLVGSDVLEIFRLKTAIEQGKKTQVVIKNYKRDGILFWNRIKIAPLCDMYRLDIMYNG